MMSSQYSGMRLRPLLLLILVLTWTEAYRIHSGSQARRRVSDYRLLEAQRDLEHFLALRQLAAEANPEVPLNEGEGITDDQGAGPTTRAPVAPVATTQAPDGGNDVTVAPPVEVTTVLPMERTTRPTPIEGKESVTSAPAEQTTAAKPAAAVTVEPTTAPKPAAQTTAAIEITTIAPAKEDVTKAPPAKGEEITKSPQSGGGDSQVNPPDQPQQPYWPPPKDTGENDGKCLNDEFECIKTQKCIPKSALCDSNSDCTFNEDEQNCAKMTCEDRNLFTCTKTKTCLPKEGRCNGYDECGDNSDEEGCADLSCEDRNMIKCGLPDAPPPYRCAYKTMRCDGHDDCGDKSDEMGCDYVACGKYRFRCADGLPKCISGLARCDGKQDCWDNSDEKGCDTYACQANWFMCSKGSPRCIEESGRCDRKADCGDMSDETTCFNRPCGDNEFKCASDGMCLHVRRLCNGLPDCYDHTDEDPKLCTAMRAGSVDKREWSDLLKFFQ